MPPRIKLPSILQSAAWTGVILLALNLAFEPRYPLVDIRNKLALSNLEVVLLISVALWLLSCLAGRRWPAIPLPLAWPTLTWLAILTGAAVFAPSHQADAVRLVARLATGMLAGWAVYDLVQTEDRRQTLSQTLAFSGVVVALLGLAEAARWTPVMVWLTDLRGAVGAANLNSTFDYPNATAMALELAFPLILAWLLTTSRLWLRVVLGAALLAVLAAALLTNSRGGQLALLVTPVVLIGVMVWQRRRLLVMAGLTLAVALLTLAGLAVATTPGLARRLTWTDESLGYAATYTAPQSLTARPGETLGVAVAVTNHSTHAWAGAPFALGYHLRLPDGHRATYYATPTLLPKVVAAGETVTVQAKVFAPPLVGEYGIEWDGLITTGPWFSWRGTPTATTHLTVAGAPVSPDDATALGTNALTIIPQLSWGRPRLWQTALQLARDRPLLGVGPENFYWHLMDYANYPIADATHVWHDRNVHNIYLQWLVDAGWLGLLAFVWLTWRLLRVATAALSPGVSGHSDRIWQWGYVASLTLWFLHGFVESFFRVTPLNIGFWLVAGLAVSARQWDQPTRPTPRLWGAIALAAIVVFSYAYPFLPLNEWTATQPVPLPLEFPADFPIYPNATYVGASGSYGQINGRWYDRGRFEIGAAPQQVIDWYTTHLPSTPYTPLTTISREGTTVYGFSAQHGVLLLQIIPTEPTFTVVTVDFFATPK